MNEKLYPHQARSVRLRKYGNINKVLLIPIVVVIAGATFYFRSQERVSTPVDTPSTLDGQLGSATEESKNILASLSEIYEVPVGDEPIMYTIDDAAALIAQQAFFTGSKDGDILFIFPKNMKAVIYSEERDKIINAGPISYDGTQGAAATSANVTAVPAEQ